MITETYIKVKPSNNKARVAFALCVAGGIALSVLSTIIPLYRGLVSLGGVILLVAGVSIFSRYVASVYYYDITHDSYGTPIFVVRQISGKRESTLCRIDLADIVKIEDESAEEKRKHKTPNGYRKYSYVPTLMPKSTTRLTVHSRYEKSEIIIEGGERLSTLLASYAEEARSMRE